MSCKSALYMANTQTQVLAVDSVISFGTIIRRFGQNINGSATNVEITGQGYYDVDANFSILGTGTGTATITLYKDGVAIPGASALITTADTVRNQVSIPCIIREKCCCASTITAVLSGTGTTITNAAIVVEKV